MVHTMGSPEPRQHAENLNADAGTIGVPHPGQHISDQLLKANQKVDDLVTRVVVAVKLLQVLIWPVGLIFGLAVGISNLPLILGVYVALTCWALIWGTLLLSRRTVTSWALQFDLVLSAVAVSLGGAACYRWDALSWANPGVASVLGSALAASAFFSAPRAVAANVVLALGLCVAAIPGLVSSPRMPLTLAASLLLMATVSGLTMVVGRFLRRQAGQEVSAGKLLAEALNTQKASAKDSAERSRQYRTLHDTVLSTLSALARGSLDASDPAVQLRCAADAEYLRSIISSGAVSGANKLQGELASVGREQAVLGLRVHQHVADLPATLPHDVVEALRDSTREALNNVAKHSGTSQAWVTGLGDPERSNEVTVTIADRGKGFDPATAHYGMGLRESIVARMHEVGGSATVDSSPGQGVSVELRWPA